MSVLDPRECRIDETGVLERPERVTSLTCLLEDGGGVLGRPGRATFLIIPADRSPSGAASLVSIVEEEEERRARNTTSILCKALQSRRWRLFFTSAPSPRLRAVSFYRLSPMLRQTDAHHWECLDLGVDFGLGRGACAITDTRVALEALASFPLLGRLRKLDTRCPPIIPDADHFKHVSTFELKFIIGTRLISPKDRNSVVWSNFILRVVVLEELELLGLTRSHPFRTREVAVGPGARRRVVVGYHKDRVARKRAIAFREVPTKVTAARIWRRSVSTW